MEGVITQKSINDALDGGFIKTTGLRAIASFYGMKNTTSSTVLFGIYSEFVYF